MTDLDHSPARLRQLAIALDGEEEFEAAALLRYWAEEQEQQKETKNG